MLELILIRQEPGRPFAAPPGVPADRVTALRRAFEDTLKDPEFISEAAKMQLEIEPLSRPTRSTALLDEGLRRAKADRAAGGRTGGAGAEVKLVGWVRRAAP